MDIQKKDFIKGIICVSIIFVVIPAMRVLTWGMNGFHEMSLFGFGAVVGVWGLSINKRMIDKRTKLLLVSITGLTLFWIVLRIIKYGLLREVQYYEHFLWYGYYVSMFGLPLVSFWTSVCLLRHESEKPLKKWIWLLVPTLLLLALIMTNDMHELVFKFKSHDPIVYEEYSYGPMYVVIAVYIGALAVAALVNIFRKCSLPQCRKRIWIPTVMLVFGTTLITLSSFGFKLKVNGIEWILFPDLLCFLVIGLWECCILVGLVTVNSGFEEIFNNSSVDALICDNDKNLVYGGLEWTPEEISEYFEAQDGDMLSDDIRLHMKDIRGGKVFYIEDISTINRINSELEEAMDVISGENTLIEEENALKEESMRYKTLNRIYDEISATVKAKVLKVESLLPDVNSTEEEFRKNMIEAAAINAYIKRRSNLLIIRGRTDKNEDSYLDILELYLAIHESLEYLNLSGAEGFIRPCHDEILVESDVIFDAYDFFEEVIESLIFHIKEIMVTIHGTKETDHDTFSMKIMISHDLPIGESSELFNPDKLQSSGSETIEVEQNDGDISINWTRIFKDGGVI